MHRIMGSQAASWAHPAGTLGLAHGEERRLSLSGLPRPSQVRVTVRQRMVRDVAERMLLTDSGDDAIHAVLPTTLHDTARACSHYDAVAATQCEPSVAHAAPVMPHGRVAAGGTTTVPCYKRACPPRIAFA